MATLQVELKNLSQTDIDNLLETGYLVDDIIEIDKYINAIDLETSAGRKISHATARKRLGDKQYIASIGRAYFHWSTSAEYDTDKFICFDSSKLHKNN